MPNRAQRTMPNRGQRAANRATATRPVTTPQPASDPVGAAQQPEPVTIWGWIARAVAIVLFVPPRLLWEAMKFTGRSVRAGIRLFFSHLLRPAVVLFRDWVIRPLIDFVRNYLWHLLIQQLLWGMVLTPLGAFLLDFFLRPIRRAVEQWLWRRVLKPGIRWILDYVLEPVARGIGWAITTLVRALIALGGLFVDCVLKPIAWLAITTARALTTLAKWIFVLPVTMLWQRALRPGGAWFEQRVLEPFGRWLARWVLEPFTRAVHVAAVFCWTWLLVFPARTVWRLLLRPLLYGIVAAAVFGWKTATLLIRVTVVQPCRWLGRVVLRPVFAAAARAWRALAEPVRWVYQRVVLPWNKRAAEVWSMMFR